MAALIHEVWEDIGEHGEVVPGLCHAGPGGADFRKLLSPNARHVRTFEARSHVEAMTLYHGLYGRGAYTTEFEADHQPFPEAWADEQRRI